jgi:diacylglycerol O-acyltransferase / wax synthase
MSTDRSLTALDAVFLLLEDQGTPMHLASIGIFEAGSLLNERGDLRLADLRQLVSYRLQFVPRLRQKAHAGLWHQAPPTWEDDKSFDIRHHVRECRLPVPGNEAQLLQLCGDLLARPLDRSRPLWELVFVTGLTDDRVAIVEKLHHSMADGISTAELATVLLDLSPESADLHADFHWVPDQVPTEEERIFHDLYRLAGVACRVPAWLGWSIAHPVRRARSAQQLASALAAMLPTGLITRPSSINRQIGDQRAVHLIRADLESVRAVAHGQDATINDVVLTAVAGGLRALLSARGELDCASTLQAVVPVGLEVGVGRAMGNGVSALFVRLPVSEDDPRRALATITSTTKRQKNEHREDVPLVALRLLDPTPQGVLAGATRLLRYQPIFNLIVTNVPGPTAPLYLLGARLLEAFPIVPLLGNQGLGVAALSYDGQLTLGVFSNPEVVPDATVFCEGVSNVLEELEGR